MAFSWTPDLTPDADADEVHALVGQQFETQQQAEQWLTASYEELADLGVSHVSLLEADRLVYGPMSLDA